MALNLSQTYVFDTYKQAKCIIFGARSMCNVGAMQVSLQYKSVLLVEEFLFETVVHLIFDFERLRNNRVAPLAGENLDGYEWEYDDDQTLFYSLPPTSAYNHQTNHLRPDERDYPPVPDHYHDHERGQIRKKKISCDEICDYVITHSQKIIAFV